VGFKLATLVVVGPDCIGSYKSNFHTTHFSNKSWGSLSGSKFNLEGSRFNEDMNFLKKKNRLSKYCYNAIKDLVEAMGGMVEFYWLHIG
jgi:hypothetical protein